MKVKVNKVFVLLTLAQLFLLCGTAFCPAQEKGAGVRTIMIDPGHGGADPGTVYKEYREKDINLKVALLLGEMITKNLPGVKVHYTRDTNAAVDLRKRGEMANAVGADLFISLHVNAVPKGTTAPSGALTLVMGESNTDANLDVAMRENDVITYEDDYTTKYEGYIPGSAESFIIFSLMQYVNMDQSMQLASVIQKHYKTNAAFPDRGARQQNLLVLWKTAMPAVLTEMGFLSNANDRKMLTTASGQKKIATALFNAVSEYKGKVEGNSNFIRIDVPDDPEEPSIADAGNTETIAPGSVLFRIQVCTSANKLGYNGPVLKQYKAMGITERKVGSVYKYYVGGCKTYPDAAELQKKIRRTTPDAFMVAFDGDTQITVPEARQAVE